MKTPLLAGAAVALAILGLLLMMGTSADDVCTVESKAKCTSQEQICVGKCQPFSSEDQEQLRACKDECSKAACNCMRALNCECAAESKNPGG